MFEKTFKIIDILEVATFTSEVRNAQWEGSSIQRMSFRKGFTMEAKCATHSSDAAKRFVVDMSGNRMEYTLVRTQQINAVSILLYSRASTNRNQNLLTSLVHTHL